MKDKEYYRQYRAKKRNQVATNVQPEGVKVQPDSENVQPQVDNVQPVSATVQPLKTQVIENKGNEKMQPQPSVEKHGDIPVDKFTNWQDIPLSHFDGKGRGVPVNGYVLVSRGFKNTKEGLDLDQGVVTVQDWYSRLHYTCKHDRQGWSCPKCL